MNISNRLSRLIRQYQTRQQLRKLPTHLFKDIGKTQQEVVSELNKSSVIGGIVERVRQLIRGA